MLSNIFGNWKTTVSGIAIAIGAVILNGRTPHSLGVAIAVAALGAIAKDPGAGMLSK